MPTSTYDIGEAAYNLQNVFNMGQGDLFNYITNQPGGADWMSLYYNEYDIEGYNQYEGGFGEGVNVGNDYSTFVQQQLDSGLSLDEIESDLSTAMSPYLTNLMYQTYAGYNPINFTHLAQSTFTPWMSDPLGGVQGANIENYWEDIYGENWQDIVYSFQEGGSAVGYGGSGSVYGPDYSFDPFFEGQPFGYDNLPEGGFFTEMVGARGHGPEPSFMSIYGNLMDLSPDDPNAIANLESISRVNKDLARQEFKYGTLDPLKARIGRSNVAMSGLGNRAIYDELYSKYEAQDINFEDSLTTLYETFGEDFIEQLDYLTPQYLDFLDTLDQEQWNIFGGGTHEVPYYTQSQWDQLSQNFPTYDTPGGSYDPAYYHAVHDWDVPTYDIDDCLAETTQNLIAAGWGVDAWSQASQQCQALTQSTGGGVTP
jgi:hypothetical protein